MANPYQPPAAEPATSLGRPWHVTAVAAVGALWSAIILGRIASAGGPLFPAFWMGLRAAGFVCLFRLDRGAGVFFGIAAGLDVLDSAYALSQWRMPSESRALAGDLGTALGTFLRIIPEAACVAYAAVLRTRGVLR